MVTSGAAQEGRWPVIALVASAGGVDALSRALAGLSGDLPASVIVLLHSDPDRESLLPRILRRVTTLEVEAASDGAALAPGRVLVAPSGQHVLITAELRVALIESGAYPPSRPSADLLLTTLAIAAGPRAIAVVLSGGGHDGATGATAVHRFGGTVLATNEASSSSFAMPSATIDRDGSIDHIVDLDDLSTLLTGLVSVPVLPGDATVPGEPLTDRPVRGTG
jgi:two-component system, chemotaxis family, protein-glutamate methylesterase/glutaminase